MVLVTRCLCQGTTLKLTVPQDQLVLLRILKKEHSMKVAQGEIHIMIKTASKSPQIIIHINKSRLSFQTVWLSRKFVDHLNAWLMR